MFLLLLILLVQPSVHHLLGEHPHEAEPGSGCGDAANYFDYIDVDDEDYVSEEEGSTDLFENIIRGPPVFTDYEEDEKDGMSQDLFHEDETKDVFHDRNQPPPSQSSGKIIPESLVIKNRTHGKLNGNLIITNNEDHEEPESELFFEEEQKPSKEEQAVKEIPTESLGSKMSISVLCIIIIIIMLL